MTASKFIDFKKELSNTGIKETNMRFQDSTVTLITPINWEDMLDLGIMLLLSFSVFFNTSLLILSAIAFVIFWHRLYMNCRGLGILTINLVERNINIRNRIILINIIRKIFGIKEKHQFSSIIDIRYEDNALIDKLGYLQTRRFLLLIETHKYPPVSVTQTKNEDEIKKITAFLRKFLQNKDE